MVEESGCLTRCCCGTNRTFEMKVLDYRNVEIMRFIRPFRCTSCFCFCCLQEMEIQAPPGSTIAYARQDCSLCYPVFSIYNQSGQRVLGVQGPLCTQSIPGCCDVKFQVCASNGVPIGVICKQWSGVLKEMFTDTDNFGVSFPMDLDVHMKAALMGCTLLIDFMFFETAPGSKQDMPGMLD